MEWGGGNGGVDRVGGGFGGGVENVGDMEVRVRGVLGGEWEGLVGKGDEWGIGIGLGVDG